MHPLKSARSGLATTTLIALLAILATIAYVGTAGANQQPPVKPANPLAHLISEPGQEPHVRVSWDAPDTGAVTGHTVNRGDGRGFAATGGATTYSDYDITPGTNYSYTVTASNSSGDSPASDPATATVPAAPSAPSSVTATAATPALSDETASVTLTWAAATVPEAEACQQAFPVAGYVVEKAGMKIATLDADATSFTDDDADFNSSHTYTVYATSDIGNGPAASAVTTTPLRPVGTPTGLAATINDPFDGKVSLNWTAPSEGPEPTGYRVNRQASGESMTLADNHASTSYQDATVQAGVSYVYTVQARTADNTGPASEAATIEPPAPATGVTASVQDGTVNLSWTAPAQGTAGTYRVDRMATDGEWTHVADTAQTSHADDTTPAGNDYTYRVQHRNSHGSSTWATSNTVTILDVPPKVEGASASVSGDDIVVTWTAPTRAVDSYQVSYGPADSDDRQTTDVAASATTFTHSDNTEGVTYRYEVRAKNAAGYGPWSEPAQARRLNAPGTPTDLSAAVSGSVIVVSWTAPESAVISGYQVRYGESAGTDLTTEPVSGTEFIHDSPDGDTEYRYEVRTLNDAGESDWSEPATAMRVMPARIPTGVSADIVDADIVLTWTAPTSGITDKYQVRHRQTETPQWTSEDVPVGTTSYTHEAPAAGTTYEYQVRTVNTGGPSPWTEPVTAVWYQGAAPPVMYNVRPLGQRFIVSWLPSTTPGVTGYQLRSRIDGGTWTNTSLPADAATKLMPWSSGQSLHEYAIRSLIGDVTGNWSPISPGVITKHDPVTGVTANREGRHGVRVHWDLPDGTTPNLFIIEGTNVDGEFGQVAVVAGYIATALVHRQEYGTTREYRVRARNHAGIMSDPADGSAASVTIPAEPTQHDQQVGNLDIRMLDSATPKLTWDAPERHADRTTGYRVYRKEASESGTSWAYRHVIALRVAGQEFTDYTAKPGVAYEYAVAPYRRLTPALGPVSSAVHATTW